MNILWASAYTDYGAYGWHLAQAFRKLTDWTFHATRRSHNFINYPIDLPWEQASQAWREADVVHVLDDFRAQSVLRAPHRPYVIRFAGSQFRENPEVSLIEMRRRKAVGLVATLDLWLQAPDELQWAPFIRDTESLAATRRPIDDGILRIAHAPTRRDVKSTDAFLQACERLGKQLPVEVVLIERQPWTECLQRKAGADIYYDQVKLGYGNNAVEAWAMGIPVVAGADEATLNEMTRRFGSLPFYNATEDSIYYALQDLAASRVKRDYWGRIGRDHATRYHSPEAVVEHLAGVYRSLL